MKFPRFIVATVFLCLLFFGLGTSVSSAKTTDRAHLRWLRDKPKIDSVVVVGSRFFSPGDIRKRMYSRKYTIWSAIKGDRRARVQRETLARDTMEIKYQYLINGFLGVGIHESFEMLQPDSTALVRVRIDEGRQLRYGGITVSGDYPAEFRFEIEKSTRILKENKPVNLFELRQVAFDMKTILANGGYPYAQIDFMLDSVATSAIAPIRYRIQSDALVHFGDLAVTGTNDYPEYAAAREVKIKPDRVYRREDILESQRRLFESGYFSTLQLYQSKASLDRLRPDFTLQVRERKPRFVTLRTGAGQSEFKDLIWDLSGTYGKRNFFGSRRYEFISDYSFSLGDDIRLVTHRYRLRFTEPWLLGIRMPLQLTGQYEPRLKDPVQDYKIESWSASAATIKNFGRQIRTDLGIEYESVQILGVSDELKQEIKDIEGISVRRKLYFKFRRDSRDNVFIARRGVLAEIGAEYYGGFLGGDAHFTRFQASFSRYEKVWPGWIMATRIMSGWVEPFGESEDVPINDRLYLGGANSIRGFRENSLGPLSADSVNIGANFTFVFNHEFRWKTIQVFSIVPLLKDFFATLPLWQSAFVDIGNGFEKMSDFRYRDLALSYGTGIQIVSPAGPIRLD
ncbi:MAG: BamA/TamA family outer membrane protein, partial [bacterium]|nr:BamA/TamA family outer membrane protein [bacterium]